MHSVLAVSGAHLSFRLQVAVDVEMAARKHYVFAIRGVQQVITSDQVKDKSDILRLLLVTSFLSQYEILMNTPKTALHHHLKAIHHLFLHLLRLGYRPPLELQEFDMILSFTYEGFIFLASCNTTQSIDTNDLLPESITDHLRPLTTSPCFGSMMADSHSLFEMIPLIQKLYLSRLTFESLGLPTLSLELWATYKTLHDLIESWTSPEAIAERIMAGEVSQRLKCDETWPSCGRCTRLDINCSGPIIRLRWSQKHQARPDNRLQKRTTHTKQSLQPSTTRHSNITGQPEAALLDSNFSSVFDPAAVDGNYALSPSHGGDGWIDEAFGDMMPELMSFGLIPNATATSIQTPELLQMAEEFGPTVETAGLSPKEPIHPEREISASPITSLTIDTNRPHSVSSQPVQVAGTPRPYTSTVVDRPLNDYSTILVEYYFKDTAAILALYDSEMNPFRSTVSRVWTSSELIYCTLQSMAASFLSNVYPQLLHTGLYFRQKAIRLLNDLDDSAIHEQALIALFMIGGTASWFDVNDTGSEYFPRLKKHVQSLKTSGRMSPTGQSQAFFENTLACWEMFLAFVVDGDENEVFDSPHLPLLPADPEREPRSIFPVVQIPHPVTGVAHEIHTTLARVGRLVRRNRRRAMSKQFLTRESILEAHREVDEAAELEIFLTNLQVPLESAIVQTGDSQTPTWHLTALAEVYRFAGLIQLYHVFPDTLASRMSLQNSHAGGDVAQVSAHEAEERLRQFTLKAVEILRSIPAESGTKDFHPFLIVAVCSGLTIPIVEISASPQAMAGLGNSLALVAADVHRARGFLRGRLQLLLHSLPKNPIQRCIDIVEATWAETDNRHESSGRPAYWMDVMMQNNWETFMA
ncbi:hypothetical protein FOBRF1_009185 [Fusarium oxysporum]